MLPGVPLIIGGFPVLVGVVDRDVILARSDIPVTPVDFTKYGDDICLKKSDDGCNYTFVLTVTLPFTPSVTINVERGFVAVDVTVDEKAYRFVTTHLGDKFLGTPAAPIQAAQAAELIQILQLTTPQSRSLLVVGDTNSSPGDPEIPGPSGLIPTPYMQFVEAGYTDAWLLRPGKVPGFTCCQQADLSNHNSVLKERVDMIFSLEAPEGVKQARVVGATVSDKTAPPGLGLWPSDHGAVTGELKF